MHNKSQWRVEFDELRKCGGDQFSKQQFNTIDKMLNMVAWKLTRNFQSDVASLERMVEDTSRFKN